MILRSDKKQFKYLKVVLEEDYNNDKYCIYLYTTFLKYEREPETLIIKKESWDKSRVTIPKIDDDLMIRRANTILSYQIEENSCSGFNICNVAPCDEVVYFSGKETKFKTYEALSASGNDNDKAVSKITELLKNL